MYDSLELLKFDDCNQIAALGDCGEIANLFRRIMPGWKFSFQKPKGEMPVPFLEIGKVEGQYLLMTETAEKPIWFDEPVDAVCAAIVELAWETLRTNPQRLCLHCAAIDVAGKLLIFPAIYKSGKSTLTACMARAGHRVFTDDFLGLEAPHASLFGLASGVGIRMRKPWPTNLSSGMKTWLESTQSEASARYSYHGGEGVNLARRGARSLPGAFIILERMDSGVAALTAAEPVDILQAIVKQNFSRAVNAQYILKALHYLASSIPSYKLRFSDPEAAAALLTDRFQNWPTETVGRFQAPELGRNVPPSTKQSAVTKISGSDVFKKSPSVAEHSIDNIHFLADGEGFGVFKLDEISSAVWRLIDEPISIGQIADVFHAAFPDKERAVIRTDIANLMSDLLEAGLVDMQNPVSQGKTGQVAADG